MLRLNNRIVYSGVISTRSTVVKDATREETDVHLRVRAFFLCSGMCDIVLPANLFNVRSCDSGVDTCASLFHLAHAADVEHLGVVEQAS